MRGGPWPDRSSGCDEALLAAGGQWEEGQGLVAERAQQRVSEVEVYSTVRTFVLEYYILGHPKHSAVLDTRLEKYFTNTTIFSARKEKALCNFSHSDIRPISPF